MQDQSITPEIPTSPAVPAPDISASQPESPKTKKSHWRHWHHFKDWYGDHKKWSIPATIFAVFVVLALIPWTRYHIAGLIVKKDFTIEVSDSSSNTPVSGASVSMAGVSGTTNGNGQVTLKAVKVGDHTAVITKKYYQDKSSNVLVSILKEKTRPNIAFVATGRQVLIKVTNTINGKVLGNVQIDVADTTAKTAADGTATVVLPANASTQRAKLSLPGYNDADVTVKVSDQKTQENDFNLTPAGSVYFLSKRSGSLDVMKVNLDGSNAKTVVAASGYEQTDNTFLSQSPDGKYVALVSKRAASQAQPQLYVFAAIDDQLLQADSGNAIFTMYGWIGDSLIYTAQRQDLPAWQQGLNKLKSYDATSGKATLLDQSAGSDANVGINEIYQLVMLSGNSVIYSKYWSSNGDLSERNGRNFSLQSIDAGGQNHQSLATFPASHIVQFIQHSPVAVYISDTWPVDNIANPSYYDYTFGGGSPKPVTLSGNQFFSSNFLYAFSPSGNQVFWSEPRDGKNALILADNTGANAKTILNLSNYSAFGWYSEDYLLLSKNGNELYISDLHGANPIKVTDYEPAYGP